MGETVNQLFGAQLNAFDNFFVCLIWMRRTENRFLHTFEEAFFKNFWIFMVFWVILGLVRFDFVKFDGNQSKVDESFWKFFKYV